VAAEEANNQALSYMCGQDYLAKFGIRMGFMVGGKSAGPHTTLVQSIDDPSKCMSDWEMRSRNFLNVVNSYNTNTVAEIFKRFQLGVGRDPDPYFGQMPYLYGLARATGGDWIPIRKACSAAFNADTLCSGGPVPPALLPDPNNTPTYMVT